ncbi:MAG TPA: response regulator [Terriglobales bacterium]|nr:response regulator [Terriglobales bacterium]
MGTRFVILCVDDEENPLVLRKFLLQRAGYDVITARSAQEALEIASKQDVDLVLSDHLMPGITGTELARLLKSQYPKMLVVLLSGVNEIPVGAEVADVFLSKVEGPESLCQQIAAVLAGSARA